MKLDHLNQLSQADFVDTLGAIFEHSPWVAERAWAKQPFASIQELHSAMTQAVDDADQALQLALIQAHPDLGTRAKMADASVKEQAGVGLNQLTSQEFEHITQLNREYTSRFGFPFIFAVKGKTKQDIFASIEQRIHNDAVTEFSTALEQIYRIAWLRLWDAIEGS